MKILLIDTVGQPNLAAFADAGTGEVRDAMWRAEGDEAERILPAIREALGAEARADLLVCVNGPGRFTSTRIGVAVANALSMAWEVPTIGISRISFVRSLMPESDARPLAIPSENERGYYFTQASGEEPPRFAEGHGALPEGCEVVDEERFAEAWSQRKNAFFASLPDKAPRASMGAPLTPLYVRPPNITAMKKL